MVVIFILSFFYSEWSNNHLIFILSFHFLGIILFEKLWITSNNHSFFKMGKMSSADFYFPAILEENRLFGSCLGPLQINVLTSNGQNSNILTENRSVRRGTLKTWLELWDFTFETGIWALRLELKPRGRYLSLKGVDIQRRKRGNFPNVWKQKSSCYYQTKLI